MTSGDEGDAMKIRLTYEEWWGIQGETSAVRLAEEANTQRLGEIRAEFNRVLAAVRVEFADEVAAIRDRYRVTAIEPSRTEQWLASATRLRDELAADTRHERFAPGELATIERKLAQPHDDSPDALFVSAWNANRDLTVLRAKVAERATEWETLRVTCVAGLTALREQWAGLAMRKLSGGDNVAVVDVNFWSRNAYTELGEELASASRAVADPNTAPDIASLTTLLHRELDRYATRMDRILRDALAAFRDARLRANLFVGVAEQMKARGWHIVNRQMGFEGDDSRADLVGTMQDTAGTKLRIRLPAATGDRRELPVRFERVAGADLPANVTDMIGTLVQAAVDAAAHGWARVEDSPPG
jgi:hypothetical protein